MENITATIFNVAKTTLWQSNEFSLLKMFDVFVMSWSKKYLSQKFDVMSGHVLSRNHGHINDTVI